MKRIVSLSGEEIQKLSKYSKDFHVALGIVLALLEKQEPIQTNKTDIPEGYELVGEVDIPDSMLKKEMQLVPAKVVTDEDLKQRDQFAKEIIGIKGKTLFFEKKDGGTWKYNLLDEASDEIIIKLQEKQEAQEKVLGLAIFQNQGDKKFPKIIQISI